MSARNLGKEHCPIHVVISYVDGEVGCSVHPKDRGGDGEEGENNGIPYL